MQSKVKIFLTGGHAATTALGTIEELMRRKNSHNLEIHWVGVAKAFEGKGITTLEYSLFPKMGVKFHKIITGRLQRKFSAQTIPALIKMPVGYLQALALLFSHKPNVVVSFGGFAAFPVVVAGYLLRIPVIIHEQTAALGLANKMSTHFATSIAIARESSRLHFPESKTVLVGNPLRKSVTKIRAKTKIGKPPVILITGGSRGAQNINTPVAEALPVLLKNYIVYHLTGALDYEKFKNISNNNYFVYDYLSPDKLSEIYKKADIIVGRSGANTVAEIITIARPAVLIPIPWTRYNEQVKNAQLAQDAGLALVIEQHDLNSKVLIDKIKLVTKNWSKMTAKRNKEIATLDRNAASEFVKLIEEVAN